MLKSILILLEKTHPVLLKIKMKILSIETSGKTFSVAINDCGKTAAYYFYDRGLIHSDIIIPSIEKILNDCKITYQDIDSLAITSGPGSFTGIRIAMTAAKTIAQSLDKSIIAIDALSVLEYPFANIKNLKITAAIDALRNEIYVKDKDDKIIIVPVCDFCKKVKKYKDRIVIVGNAAISYKEIFQKHLGKNSVSLPSIFHFPNASILGEMAQFRKPHHFSKIKPLYIRRSWAEENKDSK
jgi:tRNA threonylcarbamoyladenosine biosynthesis protein TsaB